MGLNTDFFNTLYFWLTECLQLMEDTIIFNAYGYRISLWDLYSTSTTLIAFFDSVIFPLLALQGITEDDEESVLDLGKDKNNDG